MKYTLLVFWSFVAVLGAAQDPLENIVITSNGNRVEVTNDDRGQLLVNVPEKEVLRLQSRGVVYYHDFGAKGDGKSDDIDAIAAAHAFANRHRLSVKADDNAS